MALKSTKRGRERRGSARADARLSMRVEGGVEVGSPSKFETESQNISSSGVYCTSSHYLPPLSKVQLTVVMPRVTGIIPRQQLLKCDGIVIRCDLAPATRGEQRFELACMFAGLTPERRELIDTYVTWRNLQALHAAVAAEPRRIARRVPAAKKRTVTARSKAASIAPPRRRTAATTAARRPAGAKGRGR